MGERPDGKARDSQEDLPASEAGSGLEDDFENRKGKVRKEYHLYVDTGKIGTAHTTGPVYIQILGSHGKTGMILLRQGFETATRSEFSIYGNDVGRVEKIRLAADTPDKWFCDRLWLDASTGVREFPVGQWIGWPGTPEVTVLPAEAGVGPLAMALVICCAQ